MFGSLRQSMCLKICMQMSSFFFLCVCETGREEEFKKSAHGRAAQAQLQQMAKQSANTNKGEPVLKVLFLPQLCIWIIKLYIFAYLA